MIVCIFCALRTLSLVVEKMNIAAILGWSSIQLIMQLVSLIFIQRKAIYPADSGFPFLNNLNYLLDVY